VSSYPISEMGLADCRRLTDAIEHMRMLQTDFSALIVQMGKDDWITAYDLASAIHARMKQTRDLIGDLALAQSARNVRRENVEAAEKFDEFTGPM